MQQNWFEELPASIVISDKEGNIVYMNNKADKTFASDGGKALIGKNLNGCHPAKANELIKELIADQKANIYTIEKEGKKKLIYQAPYYDGGNFNGLVEISIELPENMPHFIRG